MFPLPVNIPWRLIGAGALVAAVLWGLWHVYGRIHAAGEAAGRAEIQALWDDETRAETAEADRLKREAAAKEVEQARITKEKQLELENSLRDATDYADGLARRLREYQARARQRRLSEAAGSATVSDPAPGESGDSGEARSSVDLALEAHLGACARDAERLAGWQDWWGQVSK